MNPHIFEAIMLLCFGSAWPFSIAKLIKSKTAGGKSIFFLVIIIIGYICGIIYHYILFLERGYWVNVVYLYAFNALMVFIDFLLTIKYKNNTVKI